MKLKKNLLRRTLAVIFLSLVALTACRNIGDRIAPFPLTYRLVAGDWFGCCSQHSYSYRAHLDPSGKGMLYMVHHEGAEAIYDLSATGRYSRKLIYLCNRKGGVETVTRLDLCIRGSGFKCYIEGNGWNDEVQLERVECWTNSFLRLEALSSRYRP